ncbi:MAG: hypothetical protein AAF628_01845 [Planctomycetota bacterium]
MDFHEMWQENKRWIMGVVLGVLAFWIGSQVISGIYDSGSASRKIRSARNALNGQTFYDDAALARAREEEEALAAVRSRLERAMAYDVPGDYTLEGKGVPDLHYDQVSRRVRRDLVTRAESLGVELLGKDLEWPTPQGRSEIESTLVAVSLVEQAVTRLLDAHEAVTAADPEAAGLVGVDSFKAAGSGNTAQRRRARRSPRRRSRATAQTGAVLEDSVRFRLRADEATVLRFLETCRAQQPPIALATDFKIATGRAPGEPLVVTGTLSALRAKPVVEGS